jgi:hypothetical protein
LTIIVHDEAGADFLVRAAPTSGSNASAVTRRGHKHERGAIP